jgi:hypothetical protein
MKIRFLNEIKKNKLSQMIYYWGWGGIGGREKVERIMVEWLDSV